MAKIIEYDVICGGANDFAEKVNTWIKNGWSPLGGVCIDVRNLQAPIFQAMVKYEQKKVKRK